MLKCLSKTGLSQPNQTDLALELKIPASLHDLVRPFKRLPLRLPDLVQVLWYMIVIALIDSISQASYLKLVDTLWYV